MRIENEKLTDVGDGFGNEEGKNVTVAEGETLDVSFHEIRVIPCIESC